MFIRHIRKFSPLTPLLLLCTGLLLWADVLFFPLTAPSQGMHGDAAPLYALLEPLFAAYPRAALWFAFAFMMLQAIWLNQVIIRNDLMDRYSSFTALVYLMLMSSNPEITAMHPVWFANFFLILSIDKILQVYQEKEVRLEVFTSGLLIALAALFYYPAQVFMLLLLIALFIYYVADLRSIMAALIGLVSPFAALLLFYFLTDSLPHGLDALPEKLPWLALDLDKLGPLLLAQVGFISILKVFALLKLLFGYLGDQPIRTRKRFITLVYCFFVALASVALAGEHFLPHLGLLALSMGVILGHFLSTIKKPGRVSLILFLFFALNLAAKLIRFF